MPAMRQPSLAITKVTTGVRESRFTIFEANRTNPPRTPLILNFVAIG
jgi:hypothetical protein